MMRMAWDAAAQTEFILQLVVGSFAAGSRELGAAGYLYHT